MWYGKKHTHRFLLLPHPREVLVWCAFLVGSCTPTACSGLITQCGQQREAGAWAVSPPRRPWGRLVPPQPQQAAQSHVTEAWAV